MGVKLVLRLRRFGPCFERHFSYYVSATEPSRLMLCIVRFEVFTAVIMKIVDFWGI
jgi:hypothetical protein